MKKILVVKYTPRDERSKTKELMDYALSHLKGKHEVEILDLDITKPDFFNVDSINAYALRNYMGEELDEMQKESLEKADEFTNKILDAHKIIFVYPMWNFTLPGSVKTFLDMILQKGKTWDINKNGYVGLCENKELIVISTAGGIYTEEPMKSMNFSTPYMKTIAGFIGAKYSEVFVQGISINPEKVDELMEEGKKQIVEILNE